MAFNPDFDLCDNTSFGLADFSLPDPSISTDSWPDCGGHHDSFNDLIDPLIMNNNDAMDFSLFPLADLSPTDTSSSLTLSPLSPAASDLDGSHSAARACAYTKRSSSSTASPSKRQRLSHTAVEKTYRDGVNSALKRLQTALPCFAMHSGETPEARAPTKAAVLHAAVDYIRQLERERGALCAEREALREAVRRGERLMKKAALKD